MTSSDAEPPPRETPRKDRVRIRGDLVGRFKQGDVVPTFVFSDDAEVDRLIGVSALEFTDDPANVTHDVMGILIGPHPMRAVVKKQQTDQQRAEALQQALEDIRADIQKLRAKREEAPDPVDPRTGSGAPAMNDEQVPPPVRAIAFILLAQRYRRPIPTQVELARMFGCHRSTLSRDDQFKTVWKLVKGTMPDPEMPDPE